MAIKNSEYILLLTGVINPDKMVQIHPLPVAILLSRFPTPWHTKIISRIAIIAAHVTSGLYTLARGYLIVLREVGIEHTYLICRLFSFSILRIAL